MGISSLNHFSVVLLALLCLTSAYASRTLVDNNVNENNDDSLKKTMMVDQKCSGGGCGGRPTCPGQGPGNCQGSGNCPGQCQGSGNCPGQCQGSCSRCVGYSSGCVQYVPICQIPCACSPGNSGGGYAYGNEKWTKIEGPHATHVRMFPTNGAMTRRTNMINSGVDDEAHVVKPKAISEERNQSPTNEEMIRKVNPSNSEVHNEAHVHMVSTNGALTNGVDMGINGLVTNGEPLKPSMEKNGEDGTHETANEVFPPLNENKKH